MVKFCWACTYASLAGPDSSVPKDGIEIILRRLHGAEKYLPQQKTERQALVSAQKQQLCHQLLRWQSPPGIAGFYFQECCHSVML